MDWPGHPGWTLTFEFTVRDDSLVWTGFVMRCPDEALTMTARAIRAPNWATLADAARRKIAEAAGWTAERLASAEVFAHAVGLPDQAPDSATLAQVRYWAARARPKAAPKPSVKLTDDHYRMVAEVYTRHLLAAGRTPTKAVAEEWGVPRTTANTWVERARKRGLIGKTQPGRAGGEISGRGSS